MRRLLLLAIIVLGCGAPDPGDTKIIGHGGMGHDGEQPMNSREALLGGMELGLDGIEMDVQMTADSVLVAYHDVDLSSSTMFCAGRVNDHRWAELRTCVPTIDGEPHPIVRLDSLVLEIAKRWPHADLTFDCKIFTQQDWWAYMHAFAGRIAALDSTLSLIKGPRINVECQLTEFLHLVEQKRASIATYLYATEFSSAIVDTALAHHCSGISMDDARISSEQVIEAHKRGLAVTVFGVKSGLDHRMALAKKPDRIQTDAPESFRR